MAGDFNKPTIDDLYTAVFTLMRENMAEVAKMLDASTATNIPTGAKRWNATTKRFEKWSGSAWSELLAKATDSFDMRVALADDVQISSGVTAKGQGQVGPVPGSAVTNANSFVLSGTFFVSNATAVTNWPTVNVGGFLSVEATTDGTYIRQIFTDYNAAKWWVRVSSNAGVAWTAWKDINSYVHNHTLDSLSNLTITANTAGEILKWNGSAWVNNTLAEAGISDTSHTHPVTGLPLTGGTLTGNLTISKDAPTIVFNDVNETTRQIHCNSNLIGFLNSSSNWSFHSSNDGTNTSIGNMIIGSSTHSTDGNIYMPWAGDWLSNLLGYRITKDVGYNNVGSLCFAYNNSSSTISPGGTIAGSSLKPIGIASSGSSSGYGTGLTGTWRCLGYSPFQSSDNIRTSTLWQRIS